MEQKTYFSFTPPGTNFVDLYSALKKYYPIGLPKAAGSVYYLDEGMKALDAVLTQTIHNNDNFLRTWTALSDSLQKKLNLEVKGTTGGQAPSISGTINLYNTQDKFHAYQKELHFYISVLGPYFTILGIDSSIFFEEENSFNPLYKFITANAITVSPHNEYATAFKKTEETIREIYRSYKFVPYRIYSQHVKGLEVNYLNETDCSIFNGLFNDLWDSKFIRGDELYGSLDWQDSTSVTDGWRPGR